MIDKITYLETDSEKFPLAFTLNIIEALQDEYGTLSEWSELIPMTTDAPHTPAANEVIYGGFDDNEDAFDSTLMFHLGIEDVNV